MKNGINVTNYFEKIHKLLRKKNSSKSLENKFRNKNYRKLKNIVDSETNFRKYLSQIFEKKKCWKL